MIEVDGIDLDLKKPLFGGVFGMVVAWGGAFLPGASCQGNSCSCLCRVVDLVPRFFFGLDGKSFTASVATPVTVAWHYFLQLESARRPAGVIQADRDGIGANGFGAGR